VLAVATNVSPFFWKSDDGSSLLEVLATRELLASTIADSGIVRLPIV
jgi:hypothetical protein